MMFNSDLFEEATVPAADNLVIPGTISVEVVAIRTPRKGETILPFVEGLDSPRDRAIQVKITLFPSEGCGFSQPISRSWISSFKGAWHGITLPSILARGYKFDAGLDGKAALIRLVPDGRSYVKDGVTKEGSTIQFVGIFDTEDEMLVHYLAADYDVEVTPVAQPDAAPQPAAPAPAAAADADEAKRRATALSYLKVLVSNAKGDVETITRKLMTSYSFVAKFYAPGSEEIVNLCEEWRAANPDDTQVQA